MARVRCQLLSRNSTEGDRMRGQKEVVSSGGCVLRLVIAIAWLSRLVRNRKIRRKRRHRIVQITSDGRDQYLQLTQQREKKQKKKQQNKLGCIRLRR